MPLEHVEQLARQELLELGGMAGVQVVYQRLLGVGDLEEVVRVRCLCTGLTDPTREMRPLWYGYGEGTLGELQCCLLGLLDQVGRGRRLQRR